MANRNWESRTARQVLFTLTNYIYAGLVVVHGYGFRGGCHEALIERSVCQEVQNILALRRTRAPGRQASSYRGWCSAWSIVGNANGF